jgi:transposase
LDNQDLRLNAKQKKYTYNMTLFFPKKLTKVSDCISVLRGNDDVTYFNNGEIFFIHKENDKISFRFIACQLFKLHFAKQTEISKVFGINRASIIGWVKEYNKNGASSFYKIRSNEKRYILLKRELKRIQIMLDKGISIDDIEFITNIDIDAIDDAIWEGRLIEPETTLIFKNKSAKQKRKEQNNIIEELNTITKSVPKKIYL